MPTVIVPAHNEAAVIDECLTALITEATSRQFDVIVACNGCTDDTANRARGFNSEKITVTVLDIDESSKVAALNAALATSPTAPVVFVDADVILDAAGVGHLCRVLDSGTALAASPSLRLNMDGASWLSRSYHRYWQQLPSIARGLAGRGVYALSAGGVERLGQFPNVVADDRYVLLLFDDSEKRTLQTVTSTVVVARTARSVVNRKARVFSGNTEIALSMPTQQLQNDGSWTDVLRSNPSALRDVPAYLGLNFLAKLAGRRTVGWNRDESSRSS